MKWRADGEKERSGSSIPRHPIVEGIGEYIEIAEEEMYGEHFDIPAPETLVFVSWFAGGEVFRTGAASRAAPARSSTSGPGTNPSDLLRPGDWPCHPQRRELGGAIRRSQARLRPFSSAGAD